MVVVDAARVDIGDNEAVILLPYTFQCKDLLFVLGRMFPPTNSSETGTARDAAAQLANSILRNVYVVDESEVLVEVDEPVEAVAIAQQFDLRVERVIASPLALDLVREQGEPARSSWSWLCKRAHIATPDAPSIVQIPKLQRDRLPAGVDQIPDGRGVLVWVIGTTDEVVFVQREHVLEGKAAIVPALGTWTIQDRGTTSGLFVDGSRYKSRSLAPGMLISVGLTQFLVLSVR